MSHHRSTPSRYQAVAEWRCPLCLYSKYDRVVVKTAKGGDYPTEFFECGRCSNMFRDPEKYSRLGIPVRRFANDVGPKTLAEAHEYWREALENEG